MSESLDLVRATLALVHVGAAAVWLGAMLYSLLVVQPRAAGFFRDAAEREDFTVALAAGARWKVLALCGAIAVSGAGLIGTEISERDDPTSLWLALVGAKGALLAVAIALFVYVSWRLWPARLLAHLTESAELAPLQRRFRRVALALTVTVSGDRLGVGASISGTTRPGRAALTYTRKR